MSVAGAGGVSSMTHCWVVISFCSFVSKGLLPSHLVGTWAALPLGFCHLLTKNCWIWFHSACAALLYLCLLNSFLSLHPFLLLCIVFKTFPRCTDAGESVMSSQAKSKRCLPKSCSFPTAEEQCMETSEILWGILSNV